jgi:glycosyltransferase involved in cell wall biosynthesis
MLAISAIVPVYNGRKYLNAAIASVLDQTLAPCELIVVDDGSTDGSCDFVQIPERPNCQFPISLIRRPNGGQSAARNTAAAAAKGDFLAFLDQDDVWYPHHLEALAALLTGTSKPGWVYSDLDQIDAQGSMVARRFIGALANHPKTLLSDMVAKDMFVVPTASLVNREAFEAVDGFDERLSGYEDDDLFLRMFQKGFDNFFLPEATAQWRTHEGSASTTQHMTRSRQIYVRKLIEMFPDDRVHMRFFARDLIAPRFLPTAIAGYVRAFVSNDEEFLTIQREEARFLLSLGRFSPRIHIAVVLMKWPRLFCSALRVAYPDRAWRLGL